MAPCSWFRNLAPLFGGAVLMSLTTMGRGADPAPEIAPLFESHTSKWYHLDVTRQIHTRNLWTFDYIMESKDGSDKTEHLATFHHGLEGLVKVDDFELTSRMKSGVITLHFHHLDHDVNSTVNHLVGHGDWEVTVSGRGPYFEKVERRLTEIWTTTNKDYDLKVEPLKFPALLTQPEVRPQ